MLSNTRCPVCASTFAVAPEILVVARGWVRCGRCANIFEAGAHRPDESGAWARPASTLTVKSDPLVVPHPASQPPLAQAPAGFPDSWVAAEAIDPVQSERRLKRILGKLHRSMDRVREATGQTGSVLDVEATAEEGSAPPTLSIKESVGVLPPIERRIIKRPAVDHGVAEGSAAPVVGSAPRNYFQLGVWLKGLKKAVGHRTALVALVLAMGLQVVVAYRIEAATHYPSLRPVFQGLCAVLRCDVPLLADPDQLSVESTEFQLLEQPIAGASHQFSWHIRNLALFPVRAPALELSLNDALDRPILRKVFLPPALGLTSAALEADGRWVGEVPVRVTIPASAPPVAGYRVTAFYP